jgi:3-hydroxybutyryl-CoA dehydrogenase
MSGIKKIGVVGAGQMGGGIAQVAATAGHEVVLRDITQPAVDKGLSVIEGSLAKLEKKERLGDQTAKAVRDRITGTTELSAFADCDLVVEAIVENMDAKVNLFEQLGEIVKPEGILASNTSSLSITALAKSSGRPEQFLGVHFMNPVPIMKLVEMIRGLATSDETYQAAHGWVEGLGKTPIACHDYPGFVSNRVLMPMINEAAFTLYEGVADKEAIDGIMKLGMNHPMGPLTLADFIGLDTCLAIMNVLHEGFGDSKYRPCPLLVKKVEAGHLGRKTGHGFYKYD